MSNDNSGPEFIPGPPQGDDQPTQHLDQGGWGQPGGQPFGDEPTQVMGQGAWQQGPQQGGYPPPPGQGYPQQGPPGYAAYGQPAPGQPGAYAQPGQGQPGGYGQPPYGGGQPPYGAPSPKKGKGPLIAIIAGAIAVALIALGVAWALFGRDGIATPSPTTQAPTTPAAAETTPVQEPEPTPEVVPTEEDLLGGLEDEFDDLLDDGFLTDLDPSLFPAQIGDFELDSSFGVLAYMRGYDEVVVVMSMGEMGLSFWELGADNVTYPAGDKALCGDIEGSTACFLESRDLQTLGIFGDGTSRADMEMITEALAAELA